ncbi:hypothetical protein ACQ4PT_019792 [Festuca glaucescens]
MGTFYITAWTDDLAGLPRTKQLWLAEPLVFYDDDDDLLLPIEALIPEEVALLDYDTTIHIVRVEDTGGAAGRSFPGGASGRQGNGGGRGPPPNDRHRPPDARAGGAPAVAPARRCRGGAERHVALGHTASVRPWPPVLELDVAAPRVDPVVVPIWRAPAPLRTYSRGLTRSTDVDAAKTGELSAPAAKESDTKIDDGGFDFFRQGSTTPSHGGYGGSTSSASIQSRNLKDWAAANGALSPTGPLSPTGSVGSLDSWRTNDDRFQGSPLSMFTVELTPALSQVARTVEVEEGKIVEDAAATETVAASPGAPPDLAGGLVVGSGASPSLEMSQAVASVASGSTDLRCGLAAFREKCRSKKAAFLPRPMPRKTRKMRPPPSVVSRSARVAGRFAPGAPIKPQQRTLMLQLGIAREGEVIGDEALQAYLRYFDEKPMMADHLAACLALFGWHPDVLPVVDDDLVLVHHTARKLHALKRDSILLKLDITKVFDTVDWAFLLEVMAMLGFGRKWTSMVGGLLSFASTRVLVNGAAGELIFNRRGLRQGDPLSPVLFDTVMDVLHLMFERAAAVGLLTELSASGFRHRTLMYAD